MKSSNQPNANGAADRASINRQNALHSTGPNTESGKQRSSLNALRHGLTGQTVVLPSEDLAAYQAFSKRFFDDLQPKGVLEEHLVQTLADCTWRLNRARAIETNLLTLGLTQTEGDFNTGHPQADTALAVACAYRDHTRALANLSVLEQRLSRQFEKTLQQLRDLQAERRRREADQLDDAARLMQMHKEKKLPYHAAEDGFVFSASEIEQHIRREERRDMALHAAYIRPRPHVRAAS
jgi:hypothetical protein